MVDFNFRSNFIYQGELVPVFIAHTQAAVDFLSALETVYVIKDLARVVQKFRGAYVTFPQEVIIPGEGGIYLSVSATNGTVEALVNGDAVTLPALCQPNDEVTLTFTPDTGYEFDDNEGWVANGSTLSTDNPYTFNITSSMNISTDGVPYTTEGLRFSSLSNSPFNVQVSDEGGTDPTGITGLRYSLDQGVTWTSYSVGDGDISVPAGSFIEWRADSWLLSLDDDIEFLFDVTDIKVEGDITWLTGHNADNTIPAGTCFPYLFYGEGIQDASALNLASNTTDDCYCWMFDECTSLTEAPALPALTLAPNCYQEMFYGCTSLTSSPALPALTLADQCYGGMFKECTSLTSAPVLPATTLAAQCYDAMFKDCSSLTSAPTLPATTLTPSCYQEIFYGCTALTEVTIYASDTSATDCLFDWLRDTTPGGTVHCKLTFPETFATTYGWTKDGSL